MSHTSLCVCVCCALARLLLSCLLAAHAFPDKTFWQWKQDTRADEKRLFPFFFGGFYCARLTLKAALCKAAHFVSKRLILLSLTRAHSRRRTKIRPCQSGWILIFHLVSLPAASGPPAFKFVCMCWCGVECRCASFFVSECFFFS